MTILRIIIITMGKNFWEGKKKHDEKTKQGRK